MRSRLCRTLAVSLILLVPVCMPLQAQRRPVESPNGMVASAHALASQIGVDCLRQGGNAVDAAVATGLALSVVYPRAGNLGGGGFLLIRLADGRTTLIDFRETAPAAATRTMFQDAQGNVVADRSTVGYLASGVPGTVAGFALAWEKYGSGKLSWSQLVEPARQLAEKGFVVSPYFAQDLRASRDLLGKNAESTRVYLNGGKLFAAGDRFVQPDLAATLRRLQERGSREFYEGETARLIAEDMQAHGGLVRRDDLKSYRAVERAPLHGSYRGFEVIAPPPPSSGGVALLQILGMIEPYDVAAMGTNSAAKIHLFTEAMRRAFRDRAEYLGDPDFVRVPVAGLLEPKYLKTRMADFDPEKATPSASLPAGSPLSGESHETTHYSVVDAAGNAASCTYTLNGLYGSGVTAAGTGVLLNNEMDDFTAKVGVKNLYGLMQGESNAVAPGKRPLSSMTPTIVLKNHAPFLVTGSPGGPTIITTTLFVVTNVIDHSMSVTQAVDAPRFHHQWQPDVVNYEPFFTSQDTMALLRAKGHVLQPRKLYPNDPDAAARYWGDAESILIDPKTQLRQGANDPRNPESTVAGY